MGSQQPDQSPDRKKLNQYNAWLRYSGLGLQLFLTIGIAGWLGYKLDQYLSLKFPAFLLCFIMVSFAGMVYKIYRSLNRE